MQQDPLMEKYYRIGQYVYCVGNPVKFVDPTGGKIVDAHGQVLYQNGKWTTASEGTHARRVGESMAKTNTGRFILNEMDQAKYGITITISDGEEPENHLGVAVEHTDANDTVVGVDIIIYEGSIDKQVEPQYSSEQANQLRPMSKDDRIGTIGVHEGLHSVDKTPRTDDKSSNSPREQNANAAQKKHARELERQNNPIVKQPISFSVSSL